MLSFESENVKKKKKKKKQKANGLYSLYCLSTEEKAILLLIT